MINIKIYDSMVNIDDSFVVGVGDLCNIIEKNVDGIDLEDNFVVLVIVNGVSV